MICISLGNYEPLSRLKIPFFLERVSAGFPSPAEDYAPDRGSGRLGIEGRRKDHGALRKGPGRCRNHLSQRLTNESVWPLCDWKSPAQTGALQETSATCKDRGSNGAAQCTCLKKHYLVLENRRLSAILESKNVTVFRGKQSE